MKLAEFLKRVDVDTEADTKDMIIRNAIMEKENARLRAENARLLQREKQIYEIKEKEIKQNIVEPLRFNLNRAVCRADFYEDAYEDLFGKIKGILKDKSEMKLKYVIKRIESYMNNNFQEFDEDKYWMGEYDEDDDDDDDDIEYDCSTCKSFVGNGGDCSGDEDWED